MSSLQHFLVPLDGSAMAEAALPVAVALAKPLGAAITLLHVRERSAPRTVHGEPHLREPAEAERYLTAVAERWRSSRVRLSIHVHPNGQDDVAQSVVDHAVEMHADLIVLTTHGRGGLRDLLFGSIAQQVLRRGQTPTLVVRSRADEQLAPYHCTTILVPLDGSHASEAVLKLARQIALATGARLLLASVVPTVATAAGDLGVSATFSPSATAAVLDLAQVDAETYLQAKAAELRRKGPEVDVRVSRGRTAPQLANVVAENNVDLVILGTHGRAGLDGALSGSIAPQLLAEVHAPVLLVRLEKGS